MAFQTKVSIDWVVTHDGISALCHNSFIVILSPYFLIKLIGPKSSSPYLTLDNTKASKTGFKFAFGNVLLSLCIMLVPWQIFVLIVLMCSFHVRSLDIVNPRTRVLSTSVMVSPANVICSVSALQNFRPVHKKYSFTCIGHQHI